MGRWEGGLRQGVRAGGRPGAVVLCAVLWSCGGGSPGQDLPVLDLVFGADVADPGPADAADEGSGRDLPGDSRPDPVIDLPPGDPPAPPADLPPDAVPPDDAAGPDDGDPGGDVEVDAPVPCQPEGAACNDQDKCTVNDACREGACRGEAVPCPDDGLPCTFESCLEGACRRDLLPGYCHVDGLCWTDGQARPDNACLRCRTGRSVEEWTPAEGVPCDDGDPCSEGDACGAGGVCGGTPRACPDDGLPCTSERCRAGDCVHEPEPGWCLLAGDCLEPGERDPGNPCRGCDPSVPLAWTAREGEPCDDGDPCTTGDACGADAACRGTAVSCPDDGIPCTLEACLGGQCVRTLPERTCSIDGACWAEGQADPGDPCRACLPVVDAGAWTPDVGRPCDDGNPCTTGDECGLEGACGGRPLPCDEDGLDCTEDRCVEGQCRHAPAAGFCVIDGSCWNDGQADPGDPCRACAAATAPGAWTVTAGAPCDDGDGCTVSDACGPTGACTGSPVACPSDGLPCTTERCVAGSCRSELAAGFCVIGGSCWNDGQADPGDPCRACAAGTAPGAWTVRVGAPCDDGDGCTVSDACGPTGACTGSPVACPSDGLPCTAERCVAGSCRSELAAGFCLIDGLCWNDGQADPLNGCRGCDAGAQASAWTDRDGFPCDDGDPCTTPDACTGGTCRPGPDTCPPPACASHAPCIADGGQVCGLWEAEGVLRCSIPCTGRADCASGQICSRLPGSANVGYCQPAPNPSGTPDYGPCSDDGASCLAGLCTDSACSPHCGGQQDCPAGGVCLPAGDFTNGMQGVCEPASALSGLKPYGQACTNDGLVWDSSQCRSGHCDLSAWYFMEYGGYPYTARCTNLCTTDADCTGEYGDECNLVMHSDGSVPGAVPLDEGVAPTRDGVLACYTRRYLGSRALGAACTQPSDCRSNKCWAFAGVAGRFCSTYCGSDADCPSPMTCELVGVNLVSWWLAIDANEVEGAFTLARACVRKP